MRDRSYAFLELCLAALPGFTAKLVERDGPIRIAVAGEDVDIFDRNIEAIAASVGQRNAIMRALPDRYRSQPFVTANAMLDVDDQVARRQRRHFRKESIGALSVLAPANEAVAQNILLG